VYTFPSTYDDVIISCIHTDVESLVLMLTFRVLMSAATNRPLLLILYHCPDIALFLLLLLYFLPRDAL